MAHRNCPRRFELDFLKGEIFDRLTKEINLPDPSDESLPDKSDVFISILASRSIEKKTRVYSKNECELNHTYPTRLDQDHEYQSVVNNPFYVD